MFRLVEIAIGKFVSVSLNIYQKCSALISFFRNSQQSQMHEPPIKNESVTLARMLQVLFVQTRTFIAVSWRIWWAYSSIDRRME